MNLSLIFTEIIPAMLGGGLIATVLNYLNNRRKVETEAKRELGTSARNDFDTVFKAQRDFYTAALKDRDDRILTLEKKVNDIEKKLNESEEQNMQLIAQNKRLIEQNATLQLEIGIKPQKN